MEPLLEFLVKNNYELLPKHNFQEKVKEFFGFFEFSEQSILYLSHPKGYDIDLKLQFLNNYEVDLNFILEMEILEKGIKDLYNNRFVCYNKIIFNDDASAVTQILHDIEAIEDLVVYYDYEKNPMLLNFALNNLDTNNEEIIYLEHIIFYNNKSKHEIFKKRILLQILEKYEFFFIKIIQILIEFWSDFSAKANYKYQVLAFMLEMLLHKYHHKEYDINNQAYLILNNSYIEKDSIFKHFTENNYYGYNLLKEYSNLFSILKEEYESSNEIVIIKEGLFKLYDRPDFSSFSKEIIAKEDVEIVHENLGWKFIKINGVSGYLPTEEKQQELQKEDKKKFSFLADEENIKPDKKKGFWDNLFG